jgi:catechol 2,3-dioxygenase-like lactoylglutathione lyase family enzyme
MAQNIALIAVVVEDYDEAISFYTNKLGFVLKEDTVLSDTKRWVVVAPPGSEGTALLLARAANEAQQTRIGNQTGGRVFLFLHTDDFDGYYNRLLEEEVKIVRTPAIESWGKVAVFADLYGNLWDLIER